MKNTRLLALSLVASTAIALAACQTRTNDGTEQPSPSAEPEAVRTSVGSRVPPAFKDAKEFTATLSAGQEVPPTDSRGTGIATFTLDESGLQYSVSVTGLASKLTSAHLHLGALGVSGPVIVPIAFQGSQTKGKWTNLSQEQLNELRASNVYVNVHTEKYQSGEVRGQVMPQK